MKSARKLSLNKETLLSLLNEATVQVQGGQAVDPEVMPGIRYKPTNSPTCGVSICPNCQ